MVDEAAFIRTILADPRDPTPRLVYADWLEERGDPQSVSRAEYLRAECGLDNLPTGDPRRRKLQGRLLQLRKVVGDDWWRDLDWAKVEICVEFTYRCPQRWDALLPMSDPNVRHCSTCERDVHYCRDTREALRFADAGECVALDSRQARLPLELHREAAATGRRLGRVSPRLPRRLPLSQRRSVDQIDE